MITCGALLEFVVQNREDKVFKGYSKEEVAGALIEGIEDGTLFYAMQDGKITGMILAQSSKSGVLFVIENLAMNLNNLRMFARQARERFPGMRLEAIRHGKHRKFDTEKLYNKLHI